MNGSDRPAFWALVSCLAACCMAPQLPAQESAQEPAPARTAVRCELDLALPGVMRDILSNALVLGLRRGEGDVREFLDAERPRCATGEQLLQATARHFAIEPAVLAAEVERHRHCNCSHPPLPGQRPLPAVLPDGPTTATAQPAITVTPFAKDVLLHVVLHEIGHALVREFDLPVLGNEETLADAFAAHFLLHHLPERAPAVLEARVASWLVEAGEVPRAEWPVRGEHDNDARRAFKTAALAVAVDAQRYARVAGLVGMSASDVKHARDYGAEVHRSWRRVLRPLWMEVGRQSEEARVVCPREDELFAQLDALGLTTELEQAVRRFDWHSQVTIRFVTGDGTAGWNRSSRTVTVTSGYVARFVAQGKVAGR